MPKCFQASRDFLNARSKTVFEPVGALRASWSRVNASPPALMMRSLADCVNRRAAIESFGIVFRRMSSVTVPTWTMIFDPRSEVLDVSFTIRERERGGRFVLLRKSRRNMT